MQMNKRQEFARKYHALFSDPKSCDRDVDTRFAEECGALGFEMDCGKLFIEKYSEEAFYQSGELRKVIDQISDPDLLGSAIISRWRYIIHWTRDSLLDDENRLWFVTAFGRLRDIV